MSRWLAISVFLTVVGVGLAGRAWFGQGNAVRGWAKYMATKMKPPQPRHFSYNTFRSSIKLPSKTKVTKCPVNVYFLIDGSDSIPADMYTKELDYVVREVRSLTTDFPLSKVGVIVYSNGVTTEFPLKHRTTAELDTLYTEIKAFPQPRLGTRITEALVHARDVLKVYTDEGNVIITLSDGCANNRTGTTNAAMSAVLMDMYIRAVSIYKPNVELMAETMSRNIRSIDVPNDWKEILACPAAVLDDLPASSNCADFVFVVDGSDSLCNNQQDIVKGYLERTIKRYGSVDVSIGVTVFSDNIASQIAPTTDKTMLVKQIDALNFPGGGTSTNRGIKEGVNQLKHANRGNGCTIVLITDGPPLDLSLAVKEAQDARGAGCTVLVVGIGSEVDQNTLTQLAGDGGNVYRADTYVNLYEQDLSTKICDGTIPRCTIACYHGTIQQSPCKCICNNDYTGNDCNTPIQAGCQKNCVHGYRSSNTGDCTCICNTGYTGTFCDQIAQTCSLACVHGYLETNPCRCRCDNGWTGGLCDQRDIACPNNCQHGGQSQLQNDTCTCICPAGWMGQYCETRDCSRTPCQNSGIPTVVATGQCGCSCRPGTTGEFCQNTEPRCTKICVNGNLDTSACRCNCYNGWTGDTCNVPQCSKTCVNGNLDTSACRCNCYNGWTGDTCNVPQCSKTCVNGNLDTSACRCNCYNGWTGDTCNVPQCSKTCLNGNLDTSACRCNCYNGWTGDTCNVIQCLKTCGNGNLDTSACRCNCYNGWTGDTCNVPQCSKTCVNSNLDTSTCRCNCYNGWTGDTCNKCADYGQCLNGGMVTKVSTNQCGCSCRPPFTGDTCAETTCGTCENGGVMSTSTGDCSCQCVNGYSGPRCERCAKDCTQQRGFSSVVSGVCTCVCRTGEELVNNVCQRSAQPCPLNCVNGQPSSTTSDCVCMCNAGWSGQLCNQKVCSPADCNYKGTARFDSRTNKCVCDCNVNSYGEHCQNDVTTPAPCAADYCNYNGAVMGSPPSCRCDCYGGYTGSRCGIAPTIPTPTCAADYCNYNGDVTGNPPYCRCTCRNGYTGSKCQIAPTIPTPTCAADYCNYNGDVTGNPPYCRCTCRNGYTGSKCQIAPTIPTPTCAADYCNYNGDVTGNPPYCRCTCRYGYTGSKCQIAPTIPTPTCAADYCNYNGDVTGNPPYCRCTCRNGYTGSKCQIAPATPTPTPTCGAGYCNYNGNVYGSPPSCRCNCKPGFSGMRCEKRDVVKTCSRTDCNNHGTATLSGSVCVCSCDTGYTGQYCDIIEKDTPSTEECTGADNPCQNGQKAYRDSCTNKCVCRCSAGFGGPHCEIVVEPNVCDNCTLTNGVGYVPVKGRCDMYVQCDTTTSYVRNCAPGTLWNQQKKACDHPQLTTCTDDACASLKSGAFYVHNHECQRYWICSAHQTVDQGCCPEGQGFNSQTSKCEVDPNCIQTCNGKENQCRSTSPFCHLKDVDGDKYAYLEPATINGEAGFVRKECGPRTMFNVSLCVCVHDPEQQIYDCSSSAPEPDEELTFNNIQKSASYEGVALTDSVSGVDVKAGQFTGSGRVIWWRFANSGFSHNNTVLRLRIQPGQLQPGSEYAIISNADCNKTASLSITMTTNKIIFNIRSEYSDQKKTQEINYSASQNEWIEIELRYIRQSARGYSYVGYVKGSGGRQNTDELVIDGPIGTRTCALQVGAHGSDSIEDFLGYVDWVRVWDRCAPAEL